MDSLRSEVVKNTTYDIITGQEIVTDLTADEIAAIEAEAIATAWHNLRTERNQRLAACDWTVLSDTPTSTAAWKVYRQALRDFPANTTDPFSPEWPAPPG